MEYSEPPSAPGIVMPGMSEISEALALDWPELAEREPVLLGEGWDFWAFALGDLVLRFPKRVEALAAIERERRLLPGLAAVLPAMIPLPLRRCEDGPNGLPFFAHRMVAGVPLKDLKRPPAPGFAPDLGRFLRALHSYPIDKALTAGIEHLDGRATRQRSIDEYEGIVRRIFPLISCEARGHTAITYEGYLNDAANFDFEPCLVHGDIDQRNTLADPETGELAGVIDFGDAAIGDPAFDFTWQLMGGFEALGIGGQIEEMLTAYGGLEGSRSLRSRVGFYQARWPILDIKHGLNIGDADFIAAGIRSLNASLPFDAKC